MIKDFGSAVVTVANNVVIPLFKAIGKAGSAVADGINAIFGTKITGTEVLVLAAILRILGVFRLVAEVARTAVLGVRLLASALALVGGGLSSMASWSPLERSSKALPRLPELSRPWSDGRPCL